IARAKGRHLPVFRASPPAPPTFRADQHVHLPTKDDVEAVARVTLVEENLAAGEVELVGGIGELAFLLGRERCEQRDAFDGLEPARACGLLLLPAFLRVAGMLDRAHGIWNAVAALLEAV